MLCLQRVSKGQRRVEAADHTSSYSAFPLFSFLQAKGRLSAAIVVVLVDVQDLLVRPRQSSSGAASVRPSQTLRLVEEHTRQAETAAARCRQSRRPRRCYRECPWFGCAIEKEVAGPERVTRSFSALC